jgi:hypothetical protein
MQLYRLFVEAMLAHDEVVKAQESMDIILKLSSHQLYNQDPFPYAARKIIQGDIRERRLTLVTAQTKYNAYLAELDDLPNQPDPYDVTPEPEPEIVPEPEPVDPTLKADTQRFLGYVDEVTTWLNAMDANLLEQEQQIEAEIERTKARTAARLAQTQTGTRNAEAGPSKRRRVEVEHPQELVDQVNRIVYQVQKDEEALADIRQRVAALPADAEAYVEDKLRQLTIGELEPGEEQQSTLRDAENAITEAVMGADALQEKIDVHLEKVEQAKTAANERAKAELHDMRAQLGAVGESSPTFMASSLIMGPFSDSSSAIPN